MAPHAKATVTFGDKTITFEGPEEFVNRQVEKYSITHTNVDIVPEGLSVYDNQVAKPGAFSEREMIATKKPRNHSETVAVLSFVLTQNGTIEFSEEDIRRAYLRAGVRPPKVVSQAIRDAKNLYDYVESGSKRGAYRLTNHGDRTVRFDLPAAE